MLALKKHFTIHMPAALRTVHSLALSPVVDEDDELIQDIDNQLAQHDDNWTLTAAPDTSELASFWRGVERDIEADPTWNRFDAEG